MELSERLQAVANLVSPGLRVVDVGCDHGYVSIWLMQNHIASRVVAMDVNKGPLESAKSNIAAYKLSEFIETRLSNGVSSLLPDEVDCMVCAGMGGKLMMQIIDEGWAVISKMKELVLQPQSEIAQMREYLRNHGMKIVTEDMVQDGDKFYPMMKVEILHNKDIEKKESDWEQQIEDLYGPVLLRTKHNILCSYLKKRKEICNSILEQLSQNKVQNARNIERQIELKQELEDIELILQKYFT